MWNPDLHLIKFITNVEFTDPSYHLPHFYELFALWADEKDRTFWKKAAEASRDYLHLACHEKTGLCAEYADYDGKLMRGVYSGLDVMTGITAMPIARLQISGWIICGLKKTHGRWKMPTASSDSTVRNRENIGMEFF